MQTVFSQRSATMYVRQIAISAMLLVLVWTPEFALAQGATGHWLLHDPRGQSAPWRSKDWSGDAGSAMQIEGMMQQMGGMMEHMAARVQAGPLTPEESKQMAELMQRITDMTSHIAWMMGGGTSVLDMSQQMATMTEQITEAHKRVMSLMAASMPAPQKD